MFETDDWSTNHKSNILIYINILKSILEVLSLEPSLRVNIRFIILYRTLQNLPKN